MKQLLTILLISLTAFLVGCESSSDDSPALTPLLNEQGIHETNDQGEPLYTNTDGTIVTEDSIPQDSTGGGTGDTSVLDNSTDMGDSGNDNTGTGTGDSQGGDVILP